MDHAPRLAVRLPQRLQRRLAARATEEGSTVSKAVRAAVEAWAGGPDAAERAEIRRLVKLSDRERETIFLASNANLLRLLDLGRA